MSNVLIIDYGMGNLGSVRRAFEECGAQANVSDNPNDLKTATHVVLPGVGAFKDGMTNLITKGWTGELKKTVIEDKIPFLGICLGMQLMADRGIEGGDQAGLSLIHGEVIKMVPKSQQERIPHIGWNEVNPKGKATLFQGLTAGADVYFVHSYHFIPADKTDIAATTPYCGEIVCAIEHRNLFGVQFHPEKSAKPGFQILRNFLNYKC